MKYAEMKKKKKEEKRLKREQRRETRSTQANQTKPPDTVKIPAYHHSALLCVSIEALELFRD
jgi:hypothetical protein